MPDGKGYLTLDRVRLGARPWLAAWVLAATAAAHPDPEAGFPFLRYYSPKVYNAQGQMWSVVRDRRGVLLFGNNEGILEYDGVAWRLIPSETELTGVRALAMDANGRVYAGARGDFGYLEADGNGTLRFISLKKRLPAAERQFQDVLSVTVLGENVYFSTNGRLFRLTSSGELTVERGPGRLTRAYAAGDELYLSVTAVGLMRYQPNQWQKVPGGERFGQVRVSCVLHPEGGSLLVGTIDGFYQQRDGRFEPWPNEASDLLKNAQIYSCATTPFGLAVGTLQSGAVMLDRKGGLIGALNPSAGLPTSVASFVMADPEGGLWITTDQGVLRVEAPAPLSFFDNSSGLKGLVSSIARHEGAIFASTIHGLFRMIPATAQTPASFEAVAQSQKQIYSLLSTRGGLLVGGTDGIDVVRGGRTERVLAGETVRDLVPSRKDPSLVLVAAGGGLRTLQWDGSRWRVSERVPGVRQVLRRAAEQPDGRFWIGSDFQGVLRIDFSKVPPAVESFGSEAGLSEKWTYPFVAANDVAFTTARGPLRFDEKVKKFVPALTDVFTRYPEAPLLMTEAPDGGIWTSAKSYNGVLRRAGGGYEWDPNPLRRAALSEIYAILAENNGVIWAGSAEGLVRYDPRIVRPSPAPGVLIRRVSSLSTGKVFFDGGFTEFPEITLRYSNNALRFEVAASSTADETRNEYRYQLEAFDERPSPWTLENRRDYTNIPEGAYSFRVEARNLYGRVSRPARFSFQVLPPWYRTWWAYATYLLAFGLLLHQTIRWRLRAVEEQNRRLQLLVDERTEEIRQKSLELEKTNVELTRTNSELERVNQEKNEFMGIAAHDLKNPLGAIRGYAEMMQEDASDLEADEVGEFAGKIKRSANLMFDLVSNLLDVNRIERGQMQASLAPCDMGDAARRSVETFRERAEAKQITIHMNGDVTPLVLADAGQLMQVLDNLVSNAVKYSPPGKNVWVRCWAQERTVRFEVRDEGPGLTEEDRKRLFQNFARLSAKPTAGEHSTGLGLAIVKRLVEQMNGRVWCESEPGKGAAFLVELQQSS